MSTTIDSPRQRPGISMRAHGGNVAALAERYGLLLIVALAIFVRFSTLGAKSYWEDEGLTVRLLHHGFGQMLHDVRVSQPEPPLYFALAWVWARVFGFGEAALRSLSALFGVLTIPVVYGAARRLISRRGALITAALLAVNPFLVWYSQEARSYALFALLAAVSLWCLARALDRPDAWVLIAWAACCALTMEAHYFAVFLITAEAPWLLWALRSRRSGRTAWSVAVTLLTVAAIAFAASRSHIGPAAHLDWGGFRTLPYRTLIIPAMFLVGFEAPLVPVFAVVAAASVAIALVVLFKSGAFRQRGVIVCGSLGVGTIVLAVGAALIGHDYVSSRNLIPALVPLWVVVGAAVAAGIAGRAAPISAIALGVLSVVVLGLTAWTPKYHYQDWRTTAAVMGTSSSPRLVLISPHRVGGDGLSVYLPGGLKRVKGSHPAVSEIDVIATVWRQENQFADPAPPSPRGTVAPPSGFRLTEIARRSTFTLMRFVSPHPVRYAQSMNRVAAFARSRADAFLDPGDSRTG